MNYLTLFASLTLIQFPAYAFIIEKLAAAGYLPDSLVSVPFNILLTDIC